MDGGVVTLEEIIAHGNRGHVGFMGGNFITCADGFGLSVVAGGGTYCHPRPALCLTGRNGHEAFDLPGLNDVDCAYPGPYYAVEVGFPSERPEPWDSDDDADPRCWRTYAESKENPTGSVYGYVPVELVRALVASHGGERT
jgi:hypothetical protein